MNKTFRDWNVDQQWLLPASVHDLVAPGHLAHFVRDTVREELDLSAILEVYDEQRGYPPYHPVMMTALLLYGYSQGIYSSRRIARACVERVDFMAVTALQRPDFRTISDFRKRHLPALGELFGQVLRLCQRAGLVRLGHVALDGTKLKANASKHKAMSYGRMKQEETRLAAEVAKWFAEADAADAEENHRYGADRRGDELPSWVADKQQRLERIRQARAALEAEARAQAETVKGVEEPKRGRRCPKKKGGGSSAVGSAEPKDKAQRNFTDPDSRIMKGPDGFVQAYNCQAAVDAQSQVIVAQEVTQATNDKQELVPMVVQIKDNTGRHAQEISADSGYCSEENLKELNRRRVRGYVATGRQRHGEASATGAKPAEGGRRVRVMRVRLKRGGWRSRYRLRKQTVEPVFGQIKHARGFRQFLLRGVRKVQGEWSLICAVHNLLKLAAVRT
jgi:transposase